MLTWNVTYHCKPGKREEFFKAISALGVRAHFQQRGRQCQV